MTGPWLIHPDWLPRVRSMLLASTERLPEMRAQMLGERMESPRIDVRAGGVAIIPVHGVLWSRLTFEAYMMSMIFGGTITEVLSQAIQVAAADPDIRSILLHFDSPGGQANGIGEAADLIRSAARRKPVAAHADGFMASGAYWLASAAGEVSASASSLVGSIGAYGEFEDETEMKAKEGRRTIVARDRHAPSKHLDPATEDGLALWEDIATDTGDVFRAAVAAFRDVPVAKVLDDFGRGGVMIAAEAKKVGMIDRVGSMTEIMAKLSGANRARLAKVRPDQQVNASSSVLMARSSVCPGSSSVRLAPSRAIPATS